MTKPTHTDRPADPTSPVDGLRASAAHSRSDALAPDAASPRRGSASAARRGSDGRALAQAQEAVQEPGLPPLSGREPAAAAAQPDAAVKPSNLRFGLRKTGSGDPDDGEVFEFSESSTPALPAADASALPLFAQAGTEAAPASSAGSAASATAASGTAAAGAAAGAASWGWLIPVALTGAAVSSMDSGSSTQQLRTRVVDGPVKGAKVYVDLDSDGEVDTNEPLVGTTTDDGYADIVLNASQLGHALLAKGGTDVTTNKSFTGLLAAPSGSTVINPLTTLVAALMEKSLGGKSLAEAKAAVVKALGLTEGVDLTSYDTYKLALEGDAKALADHKKAVQVANLIIAGAATGSGADGQLLAASKMIEALVKKISDSPASALAMDDASVVAGLFTAIGASAANAAEFAKAAVAINTAVAGATGANAKAALEATAAAQVFAQVQLAKAVQDVTSGVAPASAASLRTLQSASYVKSASESLDPKSTDTTAPVAPTIELGSGVQGGASSAEASQASGVVSILTEANSSLTVTFQGAGGQQVVKFLSWDSFKGSAGSSAQARVAVPLTAAELATLGEGKVTVSATAVDAAGNTSAASPVTNFTLDSVAPKVGSAGMTIKRTSRTIEIDFTEALSNVDLTEANFAVTTNIGGSQQSNAVLSATVSGNKVVLVLASDFLPGQVSVAYTSPASGAGAIQDIAGNQALGFSSGRLADGYIRNASIFIQVSSDYVLTADMVVPKGTRMPDGKVLTADSITAAGSTIAKGGFFYTGIESNSTGEFFLPANLPKGALTAVGGVNSDTGVPNTVVLKAPEGATMVNPLTTMVQAVIDSNKGITLSAADAAMTVAAALGLPQDLDLDDYDPLAAGAEGGNDATALAAHKAAAKLATLASLSSNPGEVVGNLAEQFALAAENGSVVDLNDSSTLNAALDGVEVSPEQQAAMIDAMTAISNSADFNAISSAQAKVLDKVPPKAPTVEISATTRESSPKVTIVIDVTSEDGSGAVEGDTVVLLVDGAFATVITLTEEDIEQGFATAHLPSLSEGEHTVAALQIDLAGGVSPVSTNAGFVIDLTGPQALVDTASVNAAGEVEVRSSEAGRAYLVHETLVDSISEEDDILAMPSDMWTVTDLTSANVAVAAKAKGLADGHYKLITVDAVGNLSEPTNSAVTIDNEVPSAIAVISAASDDAGAPDTNLVDGESTDDNTISLSGLLFGSLETGDTIQIFDGERLLGTATISPEGDSWTFTTGALANGGHSLAAYVVDAAGNKGQALDTLDLNVNATGIPKGTVTIASSTPSATKDSTPVITGSVSGDISAGDVIAIYSDRALLGTTAAASEWTFTVPDGKSLSPGSHAITAVLQGSNGNEGSPSAVHKLLVDNIAPTVSIRSDDASLSKGDSAKLTFTFTEKPTFTNPQNPVVVKRDGAAVGSVSEWTLQPNSDGLVYTATIAAPGSEGSGALSVDIEGWTDEAGNTGTSEPLALSFDTAPPSAPTVTTNFGSSISRAEKDAGAKIEIQSGSGDVVKLTIAGNTVTLGSGNATYADGKWVYLLTQNDYALIGKGGAKVTATVTDAAGNTSPPSAEISIDADTTAPIVTPIAVKGVTPTSNRINDTTPEISFSAEAGSTISIDWNGSGTFYPVTSGTGVNSSGVVAGTSGTTLVTLTAPSAIGTEGQTHTVVVRATDTAGNTTTRSAGYVLDTTAISARSISMSQDGKQITLSFSEPVAVADLTIASISVSNSHSLGTDATVSPVNAAAGRASTFIVVLGADATIAVNDTLSLARDKAKDAAGNTPAANLSFVVPQFDTTAPTVQISSDKTTLKQGETAILTLTFSEPVRNLERSDIAVSPSGSLGTLSAPKFNSNGTVSYTISFLPAAGTNADVKISVDAARFTDLAGNASTLPASITLTVDTAPPTVTIASSATSINSATEATLTFTFSEAPATIPTVAPSVTTAAGPVSNAGSLSALQASAGNSKVYTATYKPPAGLAGGKVSFVVGKWSDAAGNAGITGLAPFLDIDTVAPTLSITSNTTVINRTVGSSDSSSAQPSAGPTLTVVFSEPPLKMPEITPSLAGVTLTLIPSTGSSGASNSAVYAINAEPGTEGVLTFSVGTWTDRLGNAGSAPSKLPSITVDTAPPQVEVTIASVKADGTDIAAGSVSSKQLFELSGTFTGTLGADKLYVWDGSTRLGEASASDESKAWSFTTTKPLPNGRRALSVRAEDAVGGAGAASAEFLFSIDANVPTATVTIVSAKDDVGSIRGDLRSGDLTDDTTPQLVGIITGNYAPTDRVVLFRDGVAVASDIVPAAGGGWTASPTGGSKSNTYTAAVVNSAGVKGVVSAAFTLRTDSVAPDLAISANRTTLKGGDTATLTFLFSEPVKGFTKSSIVGVPADSLGVLNGPVNNSDGSQSYSIDYKPAAGIESKPSISVAANSYFDIAGNAGAARSLVLTVDTAPPPPPTFDATSSFGFIVNRAFIDGGTGVKIAGGVAAGSTVQVTIGSNVRQASVSGSAWNYTLNADDLAQIGQRSGIPITATASDAAGNVSKAGSSQITIISDSPVLTQKFLQIDLSRVESDAFVASVDGTGQEGSYTLVGTDTTRIGMFASQKVPSSLGFTRAQTDLLTAIKLASTPASFKAAVDAARAESSGLEVNFQVLLGDSVDIDKDGVKDPNAFAKLNFLGLNSAGTGIVFAGISTAEPPPAFVLANLDMAAGALFVTSNQFSGSNDPSFKVVMNLYAANAAAVSLPVTTQQLDLPAGAAVWEAGTNGAPGRYRISIDALKKATTLLPSSGQSMKISVYIDADKDGKQGEDETVSALITIPLVQPDTTAPTLASATPADNAFNIPVRSPLNLNFSEAVRAGTGNIIVTNGTDRREIPVTDVSQVRFAGSTVSINPTLDLAPASGYSIQMAPGVIKDLAGNNYAGIADATTLNFTTAIAFAVTGVVPGSGGAATFNGTAPAGSKVTVQIGSANSFAEVTSDGSGNWSITVNPQLTGLKVGGNQLIFKTGTGSTAAQIVKEFILTPTQAIAPANNWTSVIKTPAIKDAINSRLGDDGKISHTEAVEIINSIVSAGNATDQLGDQVVADLRALAGRGATVFTSPNLTGAESGYLNYVFGEMVGSSTANANFTGGATKTETLGNLSGASTRAHLGKLSAKWLLGLDRPNPVTEGDSANPNAQAGSGVYAAFNEAPLVVKKSGSNTFGFEAMDVQQGFAGTCYLLAAAAAIAETETTAKAQPTNKALDPYRNAFETIFVENAGSNTYGIRFKGFDGKEFWVTVDKNLVVDEPGETSPRYTRLSKEGEIWVALLEKAYAQANETGRFGRTKSANSMQAVEGGLAEPMAFLLGGSVKYFASRNEVANRNFYGVTRTANGVDIGLPAISQELNLGESVFVGSWKNSTSNGFKTWIAEHAFMAFDADRTTTLANPAVKVVNPHGPSTGAPHLSPFDGETASSMLGDKDLMVVFHTFDPIPQFVNTFYANKQTSTSPKATSAAPAAAAPPVLATKELVNKGFIGSYAGVLAAYASNNTETGADDRNGMFKLLGTELADPANKLVIFVGAKTGSSQLSSEQAKAIADDVASAADAANFVAKYAAAKAGAELRIGIQLAADADIAGTSQKEKGVVVFLGEPILVGSKIGFAGSQFVGEALQAKVAAGASGSEVSERNALPSPEDQVVSSDEATGTVLYVSGREAGWQVGQEHTGRSSFVKLTFEDRSGDTPKQVAINNDTFEITALHAKLSGTWSNVLGYEVTGRSNGDPDSYFTLYFNKLGELVNAEALTDSELLAYEQEQGVDINENGGVGESLQLLVEGSNGAPDLFIDGANDLVLVPPPPSTAAPVPIKIGSTNLSYLAFESQQREIVAVLPDSRDSSATVLFLRAPDDTLNSIRVKNGVVETEADGLIREFELSDRDVMQLSETLGFDVTGDGELDTVSVFEYDGRLVYVGGDGDGLLEGEDKDDVLIGGGGADVMIGGKGSDDFIFYQGDSPTLLQPVTGFKAFDLSGGYDEIVDYDSTDKIVLKGLTAMDPGSLSNATGLGNDQFAVVYGSFDLSTEKFTALPQNDASAALVIYDGAAGTETSPTATLVYPYVGGVVYGAMPTVAVIPA